MTQGISGSPDSSGAYASGDSYVDPFDTLADLPATSGTKKKTNAADDVTDNASSTSRLRLSRDLSQKIGKGAAIALGSALAIVGGGLGALFRGVILLTAVPGIVVGGAIGGAIGGALGIAHAQDKEYLKAYATLGARMGGTGLGFGTAAPAALALALPIAITVGLAKAAEKLLQHASEKPSDDPSAPILQRFATKMTKIELPDFTPPQ